MEYTFVVRCTGDSFQDIQESVQAFADSVVQHGAVAGTAMMRKNLKHGAKFAAVTPIERMELPQLLLMTLLVDGLLDDIQASNSAPNKPEPPKESAEPQATPGEQMDALKATLEAINKARGAA